MNLDDLMAVWKSQDSAPMHGVNETLLRLALRQDEAKVQRQLRAARTIVTIGGLVLVGWNAVYLFFMIRKGLPVWDWAFPIIAMLAFLWGIFAQRRSHRDPALSEQTYGSSMRDRLERHIEQFDQLWKRYLDLRNFMPNVVPMVVGFPALFITVGRVGGASISAMWANPTTQLIFLGSVLFLAVVLVLGFWLNVRMIKRRYIPQKLRLEALLKELDGQ
jgi:hypothetical protein